MQWRLTWVESESAFLVLRPQKFCRGSIPPCRLPRFPFVFHPELSPRETRNDQFSLSLGDRRRGRPAWLRRDWRHVLAAGVLAPDRAGYRLVGDRRVERDDHWFPRDGVHQHGLGHAVGPVRAAPGGA